MTGESGIYEIRNAVNGKRYIGSTVSFAERFAAHRRSLVAGRHHSQALQRAWDKYGGENFRFDILVRCSETELRAREQSLLDSFRPEYNVSVDAIAPMRGRKMPLLAVAKIKAALTGKRRTAEQRARQSELMLGNTRSLGVVHTSKARANMSAARRGIPLSAEHRQKLSEAKRGKPGRMMSAETRARIGAANRLRWAERKAGAAA